MGRRKIRSDDDTVDTDEESHGFRISAPKNFDGPIEGGERDVTDPLFSFLMLASWGCFAFVAFYAYFNGRPERLTHPSDYKGRLCGLDTYIDESGESVVLPPKWAPVDFLGNGACIDSCSNGTFLNPANRSDLICRDEADILEIKNCLWQGEISPLPEQLILCGACMYPVSSFDTALDYCIPRTLSMALGQVDKLANASGLPSLSETLAGSASSLLIPHFERLVSDLYTARDTIISLGLGASTVMGFTFLLVLRIPGLVSITFWAAALSLPALSAVGGYYAGVLAHHYENSLQVETDTAGSVFESSFLNSTEVGEHILGLFNAEEVTAGIFKTLMYAGYVIAAAFVCLLLFLRRRIMLAIGITRVAARSVIGVPCSVFYPLFQLLSCALFFVPWFLVLLLLGTTGVPTLVEKEIFGGIQTLSYTKTVYPRNTVYAFWYLVFVLFWTSQFIIALGQITLSICYSKWYFTADKRRGANVTVAGASCVALCKHMGTAAFGALLIAIVQLGRAILTYLKKKIKDKRCLGMLMCVLQCCLCWLQKCLQYMSKNAYIQTGLFGYSFCKASKEAFGLIFRNAARMAAVGFVSEVSMLLFKLFVVAGSSLASFYVISVYYSQYMFSVVGSVVVVGVTSWFVANMFTEVLGIAVSTILQCFLADEEMFGSSSRSLGGSPYVPSQLQSFLKQAKAFEQSNARKAGT